jgi:transposase
LRQRRHFTAGEKVAILRAHLLDHVAISQLCEKHGLKPTQFYQWQKQLFESGDAVFERRPTLSNRAETRRIEALEAKLRKKDEVLGELMEEHVALKKERGGL